MLCFSAMLLTFKKIFSKARGFFGNVFFSRKTKLSYITENNFWVINYVGQRLINGFNKLGFKGANITTTHLGLRNQIIHFGSVNAFLKNKGSAKPHKSNKVIVSWWHFAPQNKRNKNILEVMDGLSFIHTSCDITKNKLTELGIDPQKIVVIPVGIDVELFKPAKPPEKQKIREVLGIPKNAIVIGSFQKDGVGWGEGLEPKLVKGPDIFVSAVEKLAKIHPVFVLLVGPSRGYVKKELQKRNIPFKSIGFLGDPEEVVKYYHALDLYLITSRIEGGPMAILESIASGVPIVGTKVGIVPDVAENGKNALLADIENVEQIVSGASHIIENQNLKNSLIINGLARAKHYSWDKISERYLKEMYSKLL